MCFNLTFESEDDLAAIAAGMSDDASRDGSTAAQPDVVMSASAG